MAGCSDSAQVTVSGAGAVSPPPLMFGSYFGHCPAPSPARGARASSLLPWLLCRDALPSPLSISVIPWLLQEQSSQAAEGPRGAEGFGQSTRSCLSPTPTLQGKLALAEGQTLPRVISSLFGRQQVTNQTRFLLQCYFLPWPSAQF